MLHSKSFLHPTQKDVDERRSHIRQLLSEKLHFEKCADAEFTPDEFDRLFEFQLYSRNFKMLSADALYALDVSVKEDQAQQAFYKLLREGIIIESPAPDVDTTKMTSGFRHHFSFLTEFGQKRLAVILLAWKREIERMKFLEREKEQVQQAIARAQSNGEEVVADLNEKLKAIQKEMKLRPTKRIQQAAQ